MANVIQTEPKPYCPDCGAQMRLKEPKRHQHWDAFWGCSEWPDCKGSREIMDDGKPEMDEHWLEDWRH